MARIGDQGIAVESSVQGAATLGIRPENLHRAMPGTPGSLTIKVAYVEELGAQRLVHGTVAGETLVAAQPVDAEIGPELTVSVEPGALHLFDREQRQADRLTPPPLRPLAPGADPGPRLLRRGCPARASAGSWPSSQAPPCLR